MVKYRLSAFGTSCSWPRVMSPTPGRSTLMTSAPSHASSCVQVGPDWTWVKSRIRTPSSALLMMISEILLSRCWASGAPALAAPDAGWGLFLAQHALRVEVADAAALAAGGRVDHR